MKQNFIEKWRGLTEEEKKLMYSIHWFWYYNSMTKISIRSGLGNSLTKYLIKQLMKKNFIRKVVKDNDFQIKYERTPYFNREIDKILKKE